MTSQRTYSVGELARIARVSVRALHHYDQIGLLEPSARTASGSRSYSAADLERLQRVLCYRELGFSLDEIATIVDDTDVDTLGHLRRQHALLGDRIARLQRIIAAVEKAMEARTMGINLDPHEMVEVFGDHDPTEHAAEAEERWGGTDAYQESQRRTSQYTKQDWLRITAEARRSTERLVAAHAAGYPADSAEAMDAVEEHRTHISRWFYDCSPEMHRGLGDMYVSDPRFTETYEQEAPGLAQYARDAMHANADRAEAG